MNSLIAYLEDNLIKFEQVSENIIKIEDKTYQLVKPDKENKLFDDSFEMTCDDTEEDNYIFEFGTKWYWTPKGTERTPQLNPVKYVGLANIDKPFLPWLGIHGKYEILNGSRDYKDWCLKGMFMRSSHLAICELNTLAGALLFQMECKSVDIKSIIGETYIIRNQQKDLHYRVKLYAKNESGWQTLLRFNKSVNVDNNGFVDEEFFWDNIEDCVVVLDPKYVDFEYFKDNYKDRFSEIYYQLDTVKFENQDSDKKYLENLGKFIKSDIKPVLIQDSYYLDKEDCYIKTKLNQISGNREFKSENQYFKSFDDIFSELDSMFDKDSNTFDLLIESSLKNLMRVVKECDFTIDVSNFHLPDYVLTEEQSKKFKDKQELFLSIIEEGFEKKVPKGREREYRDRLDTELAVIYSGDKLVDYFLILWDIIYWCDNGDILTGVGRGSAPGCIISYFMNITKIDPIKYNLLFERFLNKNRIKKSLPDIDVDFEGVRRDDIKSYMEQRFGDKNVCSVGTYANMKIKMAISDLAKLENIDFATSKMITAILDDIENDGTKWDDIFRLCSTSERLKSFVKHNSNIINDIPLMLMQPRSSSVHACATIVTPSDKTIFEWFPVKKMKNKNDQDVLVSEWEGFYLDKAGFLKEDVLGIQQLDKFKFIINLVKSNRDETVNIYDLDLEDDKVFRYFHNGWNEDVFQFGTRGLKQYSREVKPDTVEELTAMNALYRPGAMKSNAHIDYVDIKFGRKEPEYDYMLEEVTKKTYGLYLYQEQTMLAAQKLGGLDLAEADMMRKVMLGRGKKQEADKFYIYMNSFIDGAIKNGCDKKEAEKIWEKLEAFAGYGFNRCFSAHTKLKRLGFNKSGSAFFTPTIEQMFLIKNSKEYARINKHLDLHSKYNRYGFGKSYSLKNDRLIKNDIVDIRYSGERETFKVTLESGLTVECTDNHKFPTSNGEKELRYINLERDLIFVNAGYDSDVTNRFTFTDNSKYLDKVDNPLMYEYKLNSEKGKLGFQKTEITSAKLLYDYIQNDKKDYCEECGKSHNRLEVHHKNGLHGDNEQSNLATLCPSCHKKFHYKDFNRNKQGDKGLLTRLEKILKIESVGIQKVYDVEMADPYHTVVLDNGIVASNSHSAAYAVTGYICQYLKVHYPIEFWTCAFSFVPSGKKDEKIPAYISEIHQTGDINMFPPDINKSGDGFTPNFKNNSIYWSLNSVKQCGDRAVEQLVEDKQTNGEYFSFDEFLDRNVKKGSKVTKQVIEHLVLCGSFDELERIKMSKDRYELIEKYRSRFKIKIDKEKDLFSLNSDVLQYNWWWNLQQKRLCGFALFDFETICDNYLDSNSHYMDAISIQDRENDKVNITTGGYINEIVIKTSKKGEYAEVILDNNFEFITVKLWQDVWDVAKDILRDKEKSILLLSGKVSYDRYKKKSIVTLFEDSDILILE